MYVANALKGQNIEVAGAPPADRPRAAVNCIRSGSTPAGFTTVDQFSRLILKTTPDGGHARLSVVGRAELGADDNTGGAHSNGSKGMGSSVIQAQNANTLETAINVRATLDELSKRFCPALAT